MDLKRAICSLFEVHLDDQGIQRIVTPLEYTGSGDRIVVRVRPRGTGFQIDENGEAALYSGMAGGDTESTAVERWREELCHGPVTMDENDVLSACTNDERLVASYVFRVAEAAQQLHAISTSRAERQNSGFKERVSALVREVAQSLQAEIENDVELPMMGKWKADHVIVMPRPLIVIVATTAARLMEAEMIHLQFRLDKKPGAVIAIAESQATVGGHKQFERAGYFTDRTVVFEPDSLRQLLSQEVSKAST